MKPLVRSLVAASLGLCACGKSPSTPGDATPGDAATGDATGDGSNGTDAPIDALVGTLSPDPADPVGAPCNGTVGFPNPPSLHERSNDMVVADVDADGAQDIVYVWDMVIGIARGAGDGTFLAPTTMPAPSNSRIVRVGDVSGDGKPDLVYTTPSEVRQVLAMAGGGFAAAQTLFSPGTSNQLELVDVNGDDRLDIVGLGSSSQVVVALNSATGFGAPQTYPTGAGQNAFLMSVGDLTGDDRPDIAAADNTGSSIRVLVNTGSGAFVTPLGAAYPAAGGPWGIVMADVNEDGMLDVVAGTATTTRGQISVLLNQGNGVLGPATTFAVVASPDGSTPRALAAADVDGDGHIDVGTADPGSSSARILLGTGSGQFGPPIEVTFPGPIAVAFADLQGDGHSDMVLASYSGVSPFINTGTPALFESRATLTFDNPGSAEKGARIADLDGDGDLDILRLGGTSTSPGVLSTRLNAGGGTFGPPTTYPALTAYSSALGDMNNDARADLVVLGTSTAGRGVQTFINAGDGTLVASPRLMPTFAGAADGLAIADIDGNGIRDVIVGDIVLPPSYASTVTAFFGLQDGQFSPSGTTLWSGTHLGSFAVRDLDGNGKPDLVVETHEDVRRLYISLATGGGAFATPTVIADETIPDHVYSRDINGDGHADIIGLAAIPTQGVSVMLGDGTGAFGSPLFSATRTAGSDDMAFGDVNGDGHLDVVIPAGPVSVLLGNGDGTFRAPQYFEAAVGAASAVNLGDIDGDGRLDIVSTNAYDRVDVLYGRCLAP